MDESEDLFSECELCVTYYAYVIAVEQCLCKLVFFPSLGRYFAGKPPGF
jgi:hypothetical protein